MADVVSWNLHEDRKSDIDGEIFGRKAVVVESDIRGSGAMLHSLHRSCKNSALAQRS